MEFRRPVNLDLTKFAFPVTAIASIIHRISGVVIFLTLPLLLYFFDKSLSSEASFNRLVHLLKADLLMKLLLLMFLTALFYHLAAGVKHLLADFGIGEELASARLATYILITVTFVVILLLIFYIFV